MAPCAMRLLAFAALLAMCLAQAPASPCDQATALRAQVSAMKARGGDQVPGYEEAVAALLQAQRACKQVEAQGKQAAGAATQPQAIDPLDFLDMVGGMPLDQQRQVLSDLGEAMVRSGDAPCNVFGGRASCQRLPPDSAFARACPGHPLEVDCAFYDESLAEIDDDPVAEVQWEMEERSDQPCPECAANLRELWCHQAVPTCGVFQSTVEVGLLPALTTVVQAEKDGDSRLVAAGRALPQVLASINKVWPCKEMCLAVTNSCGCGEDLTFGRLLEAMQRRGPTAVALSALPPDALRTVAGALWETPLCDLYASSSEEGFVGHCPAEALAQDKCGWCGEDNEMPAFVEEMVAEQVAATLVSVVDGAGGLMDDADDFDEGEYEWEEDWWDHEGGEDDDEGGGGDWDGHGSKKSKAGGLLAALVVVLVLVVVGGVGTAAFLRYRQSQGAPVPEFLARYAPLREESEYMPPPEGP